MSGLCPCGCGKQTGDLMYASRRCMKRVHGLKRRGLEPFPMTERACQCGCGEKFKTQDRRRVYASGVCILRAARNRANPSRRKYERKTEITLDGQSPHNHRSHRMSGLCECGCGEHVDGKRFASKACSNKMSQERLRGLPKYTPTTATCALDGCDKKFLAYKRNMLFCSQQCLIRSTREKSKALVIKSRRTCHHPECDVQFVTADSRRKYCCIECAKRDDHRRSQELALHKVLNAEMEAERKQRQADIITRHSIKANPTSDIPPDPSPAIKLTPARTWQNCPDRSAKTGRCAKHDKPCFDIRTRTALCKR